MAYIEEFSPVMKVDSFSICAKWLCPWFTSCFLGRNRRQWGWQSSGAETST